jgi:sugar lactone lactonase YvrE
MKLKRYLPAIALFFAITSSLAQAQSYYPVRLDDKNSVYVIRGSNGVVGDGVADDTDALQHAIDQVEETTQQGVVFLPEGRYRISHTLYIWPGVRLIGYGAHRPVLLLGDNTPGYGDGLAYMLFFTGGRPEQPGAPARSGRTNRRRPGSDNIFPGTVPAVRNIIDANPGTFYSAISNIDLDMGEGNPGAVGIRFHAAQHCFMTHMEFRIRSGMAALNDVGNEAEDLHFIGGRYGIITSKPSPGWQFTLLDSSFEGQREAAIKEHEAGLTLVRDTFHNVPAVVSIDPGYAEELWIKDSRFEQISGPAITISNENNARTEINADNVICQAVPVFAHMRESGKDITALGTAYRVESFSHGLFLDYIGDIGEIRTEFKSARIDAIPPVLSPAIRDLPAHEGWANLRDLGAKGDGVTDDTQAIRQAIATNRILYVPSGHYRVSDTITLRPDTVLIGLHPSTTEIFLSDSTSGFDGPGAPKALLESPAGGETIVTGIGLYTGGINSRAVGALWQAGKNSLMDDVRFLGGHGTNNVDGSRMSPYNANHTGDPDPKKRWDGQFPSLWVTNGGGGTFSNIWTPSTFADAGMYVSNTSTEGHVYELSSEHHVRMEVKLDHVANWELVALQTEEEHGEGGHALPLEIANSEHILIANFHSYRVVGSHETFPFGVSVSHSTDVRFRNLHMDSDSKVSFNDAILDRDTNRSVRFREFALLTLPSTPIAEPQSATPTTSVRKLAGGFYNISGAALDPRGRLYFVDAHEQKIYRWSPDSEGLTTICDAPLDAVNLLIDHAGNLMIVSYAGNGTVYSLKAGAPSTELSLLQPQPSEARQGMTPVLPTDNWKLRGELLDPLPVRHVFQYLSPDRTVFLPVGEDFTSGALYYGTKMANVLRTFGLQPAVSGQPFYVTDEEEQKTYSSHVEADGTLTGLKLFTERGGEGVATDASGNVYLAAGEIFVYQPNGKQISTVTVPERPIDLVVSHTAKGGVLYILARTSLYVMDLPKH